MKPFILDRAVERRTPSVSELRDALERAEQRLQHGDRGGAYLELYKVTGIPQLLVNAQISTYSGVYGGMAIEANFLAKLSASGKYNTTIDRFSYEIDKAVLGLARKAVNSNDPGMFNSGTIIETAREVWKSKGLGQLFPGNLLYAASLPGIARSPGGVHAILAQDDHNLGRRPAEYANNPNYEIHTSKDKRFITVIDKSTNHLVVVFDKEADTTRGVIIDGTPFDIGLPQVKNKVPAGHLLAERALKMAYLQGGELKKWSQLAAFDPGLAKPPANLDRVFEHKNRLYQFNDKTTMEKRGVNFEKFAGGDVKHMQKYLAGLLAGWNKDKVAKDPKLFDRLLKSGVIEPLTSQESKYYKEAAQQLRKNGLPTPFQDQSKAFKQLGDELGGALKRISIKIFGLFASADLKEHPSLPGVADAYQVAANVHQRVSQEQQKLSQRATDLQRTQEAGVTV